MAWIGIGLGNTNDIGDIDGDRLSSNIGIEGSYHFEILIEGISK